MSTEATTTSSGIGDILDFAIHYDIAFKDGWRTLTDIAREKRVDSRAVLLKLNEKIDSGEVETMEVRTKSGPRKAYRLKGWR